MRLNIGGKILLICCILAPLAFKMVTSVQAHALLSRSEPADNSVLDQPPQEIKLWFSEAIVPQFSSVQIVDVNGVQIPLDFPQFDSAEPNFMSVAVPNLDQGIYSVNWNVNSALDGHLSRGYIVFSVGETTTGAINASAKQDSGSLAKSIPDILVRWLIYFALIASVGALGMLCFVLKATLGSEINTINEMVRKRVLLFGKVSVGIGFLMGFAQLTWQSISLANTVPTNSGIFQISAQILTSTPWGYAWLAREGILAILFFVYIRYLNKETPHRAVYLASLALGISSLFTQSLISHAASGENAFLPVIVNALHLVFASFWVGGLAALVFGFLPGFIHGKTFEIKDVRLSWKNFSILAAVSVGLVIATGIYSTGEEVVSVDALLLSAYGRILTTKVLLVFLAGLVGLSNSLLLHPKLAAPLAVLFKKPAGWTPFRITQFPKLVLIESVIGLMIVLAVGVLTTFPPAKNPQYTIEVNAQPDDIFQPVDDLFLTLSIKPNHPGQNIFNIKVMNTRRPPPAETLRLIVRMTYLDQEIGTTSQDAELISEEDWQTTYRMVNNHLIQPGHWAIEVIVRRKGLSDSRVTIPWTVIPLGDIQPKLLSRMPWKRYLNMIAGMVSLLVLIPVGVVRLEHLRTALGHSRSK